MLLSVSVPSARCQSAAIQPDVFSVTSALQFLHQVVSVRLCSVLSGECVAAERERERGSSPSVDVEVCPRAKKTQITAGLRRNEFLHSVINDAGVRVKVMLLGSFSLRTGTRFVSGYFRSSEGPVSRLGACWWLDCSESCPCIITFIVSCCKLGLVQINQTKARLYNVCTAKAAQRCF